MVRTVTGTSNSDRSVAICGGSLSANCIECVMQVISNPLFNADCSGITSSGATAMATSYFGTFWIRLPCVREEDVVASLRT